MENIVSLLILIMLLYGRQLRFKSVKKHIQIMSTGMILDVILILYLVLERKALTKVTFNMPVFLYIHIFFALTTVLGYGFITYYGLQLKNGHEPARAKMRLLDKIVMPFRVMTLITSVILYYTSA